MTEQFFDPDKYAKEKELPIAVDFNQSYLNNVFTLTKKLNIAKSKVTFRPSWFTNKIPYSGSTIDLYYIHNELSGM